MKNIFLVLCISIQSIICMETNIDTYQGEKINSNNILDIAPQLPEELETSVISWINIHRELIERLTSENYPLSQAKKQHQENVALLLEQGLENWSTYSYIIPISIHEENDYLIQIAGEEIKRHNLIVHYGLNEKYNELNRKLRDETLNDEEKAKLNIATEQFKTELDQISRINTYQTASRLAHYLRFNEFAISYKPTHLEVAPTYALRLPWVTNKQSNDSSILVIQKNIHPNCSLDNSTYQGYISNEQLTELYEMIKYVGFWDKMEKHILVHDNKLFYVDFEQPSNSNPIDFFHQNINKYYWNITCGIEQLLQLIKTEEQFSYFKNAVFQDPHFKEYFFKKELTAIFDARAKQLNCYIL